MSETIVIKMDSILRSGVFLSDLQGIRSGEDWVVQTDRGLELGIVSDIRPCCRMSHPLKPTHRLLRRATEVDRRMHRSHIDHEAETLQGVQECVDHHKLKMKLVKAEYVLDGSRLYIYYTADGRVDFRELLKTLASRFHCRIEMRQIGTRDAARILGGIGICGQRICCSQFLRDFERVSLRTSKRNACCPDPSRLTGICGKLRCCYAFEEQSLVSIGAPLKEWRTNH
ncbi:MAG: regulatory iron-sulfur-containing complex subunit RicT [Acidobacteriota bacterium]